MHKTTLRLLILLTLFSIPVCAQHGHCYRDADGRRYGDACVKPFGKRFVISSATYWSTVALDINSSRGPGKYERNPFLKARDGQLSIPKALALNGGIYALSVLLERRRPRLASVLRFIGSGVHTAAAIHNYRLSQNLKP